LIRQKVSSRRLLSSGACAFLVLASLASGSATKSVARAQSKAKPVSQESFGVPVKTVGAKTAPITMEVFSDYQCPACRLLFEATLRPMMTDYVAAGKVYYVHRDFPLPIAAHTHAWEAARWLNAAARIGKFEEVEGALYDNQAAWSADGNIEKFVAGSMSEVDFKRVQRMMAGSCMTDPGPVTNSSSLQGCALDTYIEQDKTLGKAVPVQATPTFIVYYKGQKYPPASGPVSWPIMKQFLDQIASQ
jgi:protein-disulfide isomerase